MKIFEESGSSSRDYILRLFGEDPEDVMQIDEDLLRIRSEEIFRSIDRGDPSWRCLHEGE